MNRVSLTWLIYGIVGFCIAIIATQNVISIKSSTAILTLYGIIGIVLVFTIKNKKENFHNIIENYETQNDKIQNN